MAFLLSDVGTKTNANGSRSSKAASDPVTPSFHVSEAVRLEKLRNLVHNRPWVNSGFSTVLVHFVLGIVCTNCSQAVSHATLAPYSVQIHNSHKSFFAQGAGLARELSRIVEESTYVVYDLSSSLTCTAIRANTRPPIAVVEQPFGWSALCNALEEGEKHLRTTELYGLKPQWNAKPCPASTGISFDDQHSGQHLLNMISSFFTVLDFKPTTVQEVKQCCL